MAYQIVDLHDGTVQSRFTLPDRATYTGQRLPSGEIHWTFPPFFGRAVAGVLGQEILWGHGDEPLLFILDEAGRRIDSLGLELPRHPLEPGDIDRAKSERMSRPNSTASQRRFWDDLFAEVEFPRWHPSFDELLVGRDETIWLRTPPLRPEDSVQWLGFERTGVHRKALVVPPGLRILQFLDSAVLVIEASDVDVEKVSLLRLLRESGEG